MAAYFEIRGGKLTGQCSMYADTFEESYKPLTDAEGADIAHRSVRRLENAGSTTYLDAIEFSADGKEIKYD